MSEKIIDEVMGLVDSLWVSVVSGGYLDAGRTHDAIRAKLREVLERKPLTDEQLADALRAGGIETQYHTDFLRRETWTTCGSMDPRKIARAIEKHHGIGT